MPTLSESYPGTCDLVIAFAIALPPDGCVGCLFCRRSRNMKKAQPAYPALCRRGTDCAFNLQVHALPAKDGVAFLTEGLQGVKPYIGISLSIFFSKQDGCHKAMTNHPALWYSPLRDRIPAPYDRCVDALRFRQLRLFRHRLRDRLPRLLRQHGRRQRTGPWGFLVGACRLRLDGPRRPDLALPRRYCRSCRGPQAVSCMVHAGLGGRDRAARHCGAGYGPLGICARRCRHRRVRGGLRDQREPYKKRLARSEEHTSELQSPCNLVCRL